MVQLINDDLCFEVSHILLNLSNNISKEVYIWSYTKNMPQNWLQVLSQNNIRAISLFTWSHAITGQSINSQSVDGITTWVRIKCIDSVLGQIQSAFDLKSRMSHWNFPNMYFDLPRTQSWMSLFNIRIIDYILQYILLFPWAAKIQF